MFSTSILGWSGVRLELHTSYVVAVYIRLLAVFVSKNVKLAVKCSLLGFFTSNKCVREVVSLTESVCPPCH